MSKPRNPRYFPRMKVRGASRRMVAPYQRAAGTFDRFGDAVANTLRQLQWCMENYAYYRPPFMLGADQGATNE